MAWCSRATHHYLITWANVGPALSHHMASLGHNEFILASFQDPFRPESSHVSKSKARDFILRVFTSLRNLVCDSALWNGVPNHKIMWKVKNNFAPSMLHGIWYITADYVSLKRDPSLIIHYYSTGVQIVSCTLSDDSVLSESTGLFNPVLCVSQWNLFWQKNQPMRLCLSNQVRSAREWFPSPLGDFIRLFEGLIGELFQIWHWNMFYFFKWHQSGP